MRLVSISLVSILGPNKVNEARMGWNRFAEGFFPEDRSFNPSSIGLNVGTGYADEGLPVIAVGSYSVIGASKFIADAAPNGFALSGQREVSAGFYPITATGDVGLGNPFLGGGGPRGIQLAAKFTF